MKISLYLQVENSIKKYLNSDSDEDMFKAFVLQDLLSLFIRCAMYENMKVARTYNEAMLDGDYGALDDIFRIFLRQMICIHEETKVYMHNMYDDKALVRVAEGDLDKCNQLFKSFLPSEISDADLSNLVLDTIIRLRAKEKYDKEMVYYAIKGMKPGRIDFLKAKRIIVKYLGMDEDETFLIKVRDEE